MIELQLLLATFATWANRRQGSVIAYLVEENRVPKEQFELGGRRLYIVGHELALKVRYERFADDIVTISGVLSAHRRKPHVRVQRILSDHGGAGPWLGQLPDCR